MSASKQLQELIDGEPGIGDNAAECSGSHLLVIGDDGPGVRIVPAEHHVAPGLAAEDEPGPLQCSADFTA